MVSYHGQKFIVYVRAESVEGTAPTGAYTSISQHTSVEVHFVTNTVKVGLSGGVDLASIGKGVTYAEITLSGAVGPDFKTFILANASSDTSFTLVCKDATDTYSFYVTGCKVKSHTVRASIRPSESAMEFELTIWGFASITSGDPASSSFTAVSAGFSNWSDVTVAVGAAGGSPSTSTIWRSFSFTVENDLEVVPDNTGTPTSIKRGARTLSGTLTYTSDGSLTEYTELKAGTLKKIAISVTSLSYTFDNSAWEDAAQTMPRSAVVEKPVNWTGGTLTMA